MQAKLREEASGMMEEERRECHTTHPTAFIEETSYAVAAV